MTQDLIYIISQFVRLRHNRGRLKAAYRHRVLKLDIEFDTRIVIFW